MRETSTILCELLRIAKKAAKTDDIIAAIEVMLTKEEVASVDEVIAKWGERG